MASLSWCKKQKRGIKLIEPNQNLCDEYLRTADETLQVLKTIQDQSNVWKATTKYYCEYFSVYALLMKIGIKSEIHDCTIEVSRLLEKEGILPKGYARRLDEDKELRADNQYYLKNRPVPIDYKDMLQFVLTIKDVCLKLTKEQINSFRAVIEKDKEKEKSPRTQPNTK